jgi:hypothetical protein
MPEIIQENIAPERARAESKHPIRPVYIDGFDLGDYLAGHDETCALPASV